MYSEKDLKVVETSIPIYVKEDPKRIKKKPKRGHFKHTGSLLCSEKELSPVRRYTTALVYDFDKMGPQFAFLFSRDDAPYQKTENRLMRTMSMTVNFDWAYLDKEQLEIHEVYVRGWWDVKKNKKFVHKTGKLLLKDYMNFDNMTRDEDGNAMNPEYGIKMFIPNYPGVYRGWKDLEQLGTWSEEQQYENTYIHPIADKTVGILPPSWSRYGTEKEEVKKKRNSRAHRAADELRRDRVEQIAHLEQEALLQRRQAEAPRRNRRGAQTARGLDPLIRAAILNEEGIQMNVNATHNNINPGEWDEPGRGGGDIG